MSFAIFPLRNMRSFHSFSVQEKIANDKNLQNKKFIIIKKKLTQKCISTLRSQGE